MNKLESVGLFVIFPFISIYTALCPYCKCGQRVEVEMIIIKVFNFMKQLVRNNEISDVVILLNVENIENTG